jgi:hypothetical protein
MSSPSPDRATNLREAYRICTPEPLIGEDIDRYYVDLSSVPHPILLFLPDCVLTRLAKYAPDIWAWGRKVFYFKTNRPNLLENNKNLVSFEAQIENSQLPVKQERMVSVFL